MKNLAGDPHATTECRAELDAAGVPVEVLDKPYGEPQSRVGGKLGDFTFRRAWYYWIVCGPMPLQQAEAMYAHADGARDVRVAGHCGCPPPREWAEWKGTDGVDLARDQDGSQLAAWLAFSARFPAVAGTAEPCRFVADPSAEPGAVAFVTSYHVDTAAGLRLLADTIKSLPTCITGVA